MPRTGTTKRRSWLRAGPWAVATLILVLSGCVKIKPPERLPWPPSEDLRSRLGRVGVTATASTPVVEISGPAGSRGQGALRGMTAGATLGGGAGCLATGYLCPAGAVAGGLVGAILTAPVGAIMAAPAKLEELEALLRRVVAELDIPRALRDPVVVVGREETGRMLEPDSPAGGQTYEAAAIQTRLEVTVEQVALMGFTGVTPPVALRMRVRTRLLGGTDGSELYSHSLTYQGSSHDLDSWREARLHQEFERALTSLAEKIVEEVFLLTPWL